MAKIIRYNGNLKAFASDAPGTERTIFGDVAQADDLTSQINLDFLRGWGIVGASDQPTLEDFNAVMYTHGQLSAYLHQMGVPEYNAAQEYFIGSVTQFGGDTYVCIQEPNIGNTPGPASLFWRNTSDSRASIGSLNVKMDVSAASAIATLTADQVTALVGITGRAYRLDSFSKTINLATTGAGGMDTGAAPANGYVALYAIYNPVSGASALLAKNASAGVQTPAYTGANMPAGYTASALLTVLPTNISSQFKICAVRDRKVAIQLGTFFSFAANIPGQNISIANFIPFNAKEVWGELSASCNAMADVSISVNGDNASGQSQQNMSTYIGSVTAVFISNFANVLLTTPQMIGIGASTTAGTPLFNYYVGGYSI